MRHFSCDDCDFKTYNKSNLFNHIQVKHLPQDSNKNNCYKCGKNFSFSSSFKRHVMICDLPLECRQPLRKVKRFCCDHCEYKTHGKSILTNHIRQKHLPRDPDSNKCSKCAKTYSSQLGLRAHFKICGRENERIDPLRRYSCHHCEYKTNIKSILSYHIHGKHLKQDQNKCKKCAKIFSFRSSLVSHSKICGLPKNLKPSSKLLRCDHCNYKTITKRNLSNHMKVKHLPGYLDANQCVNCKKIFSTQQYFKKHLQICGQTNVRVDFLKRFSCDLCDYKAKLKSILSYHIQARHLPQDHEKNKCSKCKKSFSWKSNLSQHLKICGRPKDFKRLIMRYSCGDCNYKTHRKNTLIDHIRSKHSLYDLDPYNCSRCGKSYSWRCNLLSHFKKCGISEKDRKTLHR